MFFGLYFAVAASCCGLVSLGLCLGCCWVLCWACYVCVCVVNSVGTRDSLGFGGLASACVDWFVFTWSVVVMLLCCMLLRLVSLLVVCSLCLVWVLLGWVRNEFADSGVIFGCR